MTAPDLITHLEQRGVTLGVQGDGLTLKGKRAALTPELREAVKARKLELIALLSAPEPAQTLEPAKGTDDLEPLHPDAPSLHTAPLVRRLAEAGVPFTAKSGVLVPMKDEHAHYAAPLAEETQRYLAWAQALLEGHAYVWTEAPLDTDATRVRSSQKRDAGDLAALRIWCDTHALWGSVKSADGEPLEAWGERPVEFWDALTEHLGASTERVSA